MWRLVRVPLLVMASLITGLASAASRTITVNAPAGPFAGLERNGVVEFRGIRYAQPPVGALRWARPRPPGAEHREQVDGPPVSCPQNVPSVFSQPSVSEDCLFLNVFFSPVRCCRASTAGREEARDRLAAWRRVVQWVRWGLRRWPTRAERGCGCRDLELQVGGSRVSRSARAATGVSRGEQPRAARSTAGTRMGEAEYRRVRR